MATQWTAGTTSGQVLTAATMNTIGAAWETWTPTLTASTTNPTLGTGSTAAGRYGRVNKEVYGNAQISFGTSGTNAGSGFYYVSLPVTAQAAGVILGTYQAYDNSTATIDQGLVIADTTTKGLLYRNGVGGSVFLVASGVPWAWAASDFIRIWFTYEAA
jgi:hypothetical protein